ncbi:MAG: ATP-binding cassette domain-containing protein, partial [Candidatus Cloacimonetes bacterium]|nr:ATP-binding cassette domain-containing protein [Candidatus Cloacimonadota bacterium]
MNESIYRIRNFCFTYPFNKNTITLNGEINILQNDIVLINGVSGVGKSTLLYALKGLIPNVIMGAMEGEIIYKDRNISDSSIYERIKIGYLFQNPSSQMINRTVKQELAFGLENLEMSPIVIGKKVNNFLHEFSLTHLSERELYTLSGGEKQIIALLSVLITDPEVVLFDEPTSFLDPVSARNFFEIFSTFARHKTIVIIEHNHEYLKHYITRFIEIDDTGNIVEKPLSQIRWSKNFPLKVPDVKITDKLFISIRNLSFSFPQKEILKDLFLDICKGEIISIVGVNGSGKTTLLKIISNANKNYTGNIKLEGRDIKLIDKKELYSRIAIVMQNPENHFLFNSA